MNSLKAYLKKEFLEGIRTHRFLILGVGIIFFAIADPILLKLMPDILRNQFGDLDITSMMDLNQKQAVMNYMKDLYQISSFVVALSLMGILASEKSNKTLTLPVSMGCNRYSIVASKLIVYSIYLVLLSVLGMTITYYYSGIVFEMDFASFQLIIKAGLLQGLFYSFLVSIVIFLSSHVSKSFLAGIGGLLVIYVMPLLEGFIPIGKYLPTQLLTEAKYFSNLPSTELYTSLIWTIGLSIIFTILAGLRLETTELV